MKSVYFPDEQSGQLFEAIRKADELRAQHNGIFGVELFLGHDGNNVCTLYGGPEAVIGKGEIGTNLLNAVIIAERDYRYRRLLEGSTTSASHAVDDAIERAIVLFGGQSSGVFNTACFGHALNDREPHLTSDQVVAILLSRLRVVRLRGGCHWLRLPEEFARYNKDDNREAWMIRHGVHDSPDLNAAMALKEN